ncbi:MAG: HAD family hydrolase [Rhodobacteraceae bacterium]|nr:HAD family hydrolase [Paracoccaceae bacterium]
MTSEIKGVIFDKDGTLFDYQETWVVWCEHVLDDLAESDIALKQRLALAVGFDLPGHRFVSGSLIVNASAGEVNAAWARVLPGVSAEQVNLVSEKNLVNLPCRPVCDLPDLMVSLRGTGRLLGLATNDYEAGAVMQLNDAGISDLFDFVCGFDSGHGVKPDPGMIHGFCTATGLEPSQVAMVGDSTHDLQAGRFAGVGLNIGVLSGPANAADLQEFADLLVPDISHLPQALRG